MPACASMPRHYVERLPALLRRSMRQRLALLRVAHQRDEAIDAVHELAVGHGDEQREHHAEMQREQQRPIAGVARSTSSSRPVRLVRNSMR